MIIDTFSTAKMNLGGGHLAKFSYRCT